MRLATVMVSRPSTCTPISMASRSSVSASTCAFTIFNDGGEVVENRDRDWIPPILRRREHGERLTEEVARAIVVLAPE